MLLAGYTEATDSHHEISFVTTQNEWPIDFLNVICDGQARGIYTAAEEHKPHQNSHFITITKSHSESNFLKWLLQ